MDLAVALTAFVIVFPAELPDKTALASLVLGTRYRPIWVLAGAGAAFVVHVVLAVAAGSLLTLLPHRTLEGVVAGLFLLGAALLLGGCHGVAGHDERVEGAPSRSPARVALTSFGVVLIAEFGDLTQIVTATLAAAYHAPLSVGVGSVLALWTVGALAAFGGERVARLLPIQWVVRAAAAAMTVLAVVSLVAAVRG